MSTDSIQLWDTPKLLSGKKSGREVKNALSAGFGANIKTAWHEDMDALKENAHGYLGRLGSWLGIQPGRDRKLWLILRWEVIVGAIDRVTGAWNSLKSLLRKALPTPRMPSMPSLPSFSQQSFSQPLRMQTPGVLASPLPITEAQIAGRSQLLSRRRSQMVRPMGPRRRRSRRLQATFAYAELGRTERREYAPAAAAPSASSLAAS